MDKRKIALLACVIVLGLSLIGCGRGSSNTESGSSSNASAQAASASSSAEDAADSTASASDASAADYKANFIGTWDAIEIKLGDTTYDGKTLSQARKNGYDSYFVFNEDGTANLVMGTQVSKFTWEATSDTEATLSNDAGKMPVVRSNDEIACGDKNSYMGFKKGKARDSLPTESSASSSSASASSASSEEVSVDLKEWLDSYEAFVDEYVEFMKNYQESGDAMSMLSDYTDYMQRYSEFLDKANKLDTSKMSAADYAYYIDVTTRISKKLLEVSGL